VQPQLSRDVTVPGTAAHGAFITSLTTHTIEHVKPVKPFPLVFDGNERPQSDYPSIFFPAGLVTVNRDVTFGAEHDTAVVNMGRFRPNDGADDGTEQVVDSIGLDVGYSNSSDSTPPQITQVGAVKTGATTFSAFVHVADESGSLHRVAVLWNDGSTTWRVQQLTNAGDDLWTGTITSSADVISLDAEAQDNAGNVGFSFNKAVNFQSVQDTGAGPSITIDTPLPNAVFKLHQFVKTSFACSDPGGVASCRAHSDGGIFFRRGGLLITLLPGDHTFTVESTDLAGHKTTKVVHYVVRFDFSGFLPPVKNPPILNVENAGRTIPVKWVLEDIFGINWPFRSAVQSISSKAIRCPSASVEPVPDEVPIGLSGLRVDYGVFQFNWATKRTWAGTCRRLYVHLSDGTTPVADFQFR